MASLTLHARQGDTLDALVWREAGLGGAAIGAVLDANPGLADLGVELPIGTAVLVPDLEPATVAQPLVNLWD